MAETSFIGRRRHGGDFLERLLQGLLGVMDHAADAERFAESSGLLQRMDPRLKTLGLLTLILTAVLVKSLLALAWLFGCALVLALSSGVSIGRLALQVWVGVLLFTGLIALPAIFLVSGDVIAAVPWLGWTLSWQGLRAAAFLVGRAETAATLALLLILTTPWPHVLKALRSLGVPLVLVVILGMTHRYIFVLLTTALSLIEARRSRIMGPLPGRERRRVVMANIGSLLEKALQLGEEVHLAMVARGYRGELRILHDFHCRARDWVLLSGLLAAGAVGILISWEASLAASFHWPAFFPLVIQSSKAHPRLARRPGRAR